jgi:hypothetical protein
MWAEFQKKLAFAHQVDDLYDASQTEINAAKDVLTNTMTELDRLNNLTFVGEGTEVSPYEISNPDLLLKMDRLVNSADATARDTYRAAYYTLTTDIDMTNMPWSPLGGSATTTAFTGGFDGGGKTISNLKLNGTTYLGFFGFVTGATIKNLNLKDFSIEGTNTISGLVAYANTATTITNCTASGTIIASGTNVGGIAGYLNGTVSGCNVEVDISGSGNYIGGIVGYFVLGTIENCSVRNYSAGNAIASTGYVGGIVGGISSGQNVATIKDCQAKANIVGLNAGGIVGYATSSGTTADRIVIAECYFDGMLTPATAGGILGRFSGTLATDVNIANCYTTMRIGNGLVAGGIVGDTNSTYGAGKLVITDSFALNEQVSGETTAQAIHAFGEDNPKLGDTQSAKAWNGMLIRVNGETQAAPSGASAISYEALQAATGWPAAFQSSPWTYTPGKLPVLTSLSDMMSSDFPVYLTGSGGRQDIADAKELFILINSADALVKATWTAESWETLTTALNAARILLYNDRATQNEVDAAATALQAAIDGLEPYKEITTLMGEGTAEAPFLVGSVEDYEEMSRLLDISDFYRAAYYKLTSDIDLQGTLRLPMPYTIATSWSDAPAFTGDFDGGGFTISNLTVKYRWATGMFGYVDGARIHDLNLENCAISASGSWTGAIVGWANNTVLKNINVTGTVTGTSSLGGIVGLGSSIGSSSAMKNCHFEGTIEAIGEAYSIGGLSGEFSDNIEDCSFKGKLVYTGSPQRQVTMGGIVGSFSGKDIKGCSVEADIVCPYRGEALVNAAGWMGGVVGRFDGENIIDCHFKGKIDTRGEDIGGIVGWFRGLTIQGCTSEGEINMNHPNENFYRPAGGIAGSVDTGNISTGSNRDVLIDNNTSSMGISGFREAGGIGGTVTGSGSLTISNSKAMNGYLNNSLSDYYVDPFLFGKGWYDAFTGSLTLEDNYIWEGMLINGKTLAEWMAGTYNENKYTDDKGFTIITGPQNPNQDPGPSDPGDSNSNPNPGSGPTGSFAPTGIGSSDADSAATGIATAGQTGSGQTLSSSGTRDTVVTPPVPETPLSDSTTATEVSLTPIPLGLGFQTVANTILTLAVGFVTLGIFILGGFIFWRMYRRRVDAK